jgi:hypothetical protein
MHGHVKLKFSVILKIFCPVFKYLVLFLKYTSVISLYSITLIGLSNVGTKGHALSEVQTEYLGYNVRR